MSPIATPSTGTRDSMPPRTTSASGGARSISARMACRARSMLRDSRCCASANRKTTVARLGPLADGDRADDGDGHQHVHVERAARERAPVRGGPDTRRRLAIAMQRGDARRPRPARAAGAGSRPGRHPRPSAAAAAIRRRPRRCGSSCSSHARIPVSATARRSRRSTAAPRRTDVQPPADDVRRERFEAGEVLQSALDDRHFLMAVHALDA